MSKQILRPKYIKMKVAAEYTGFSVSHLYSQIHDGHLKIVKMGHSTRIALDEIDRWQNAQIKAA